MKRILIAACALALLMAGCTPALAAEAPSSSQEPVKSCYYPIAVDSYTSGPFDELRISKTYQLSIDDDPRGIPTEDFDSYGRHYFLVDMIRENDVGVDTKPHTETITLTSDTNQMDTILNRLDAEMEFTTEDGYTGLLKLDHTSVKVEANGYKTSSRTVTASRVYPGLSDADVSLIPKTVVDNGRTLTLADVKWTEAAGTDGEGNPATRYAATATYTGTASSQYATGYTVTADYSGEVAKTDCSMVTYTAIFGSTEIPEDQKKPAPSNPATSDDPEAPDAPIVSVPWQKPVIIGGAVIAVIAALALIIKKVRERR